VVNIDDLSRFDKDEVVDEGALVRAGLVKGKRDGIKLLGRGEIDFPVTVKVHHLSKTAQQKIEAAGGTVEVI
jgi:large subunit ribosomal protein L15